jgi:hypothetical protein
MKRFAVVALAIASVAATYAPTALAADRSVDRVVAMYFHRTQRCPTCLKMGSYSEEFHYVDFQDKNNAAITKAYRVSGPALMVAKVENNKVITVANLKDIWTKVRDKKAFLKYVQDNIEALRKPAPQTATRTSTSH